MWRRRVPARLLLAVWACHYQGCAGLGHALQPLALQHVLKPDNVMPCMC